MRGCAGLALAPILFGCAGGSEGEVVPGDAGGAEVSLDAGGDTLNDVAMETDACVEGASCTPAGDGTTSFRADDSGYDCTGYNPGWMVRLRCRY